MKPRGVCYPSSEGSAGRGSKRRESDDEVAAPVVTPAAPTAPIVIRPIAPTTPANTIPPGMPGASPFLRE